MLLPFVQLSSKSHTSIKNGHKFDRTCFTFATIGLVTNGIGLAIFRKSEALRKRDALEMVKLLNRFDLVTCIGGTLDGYV